MKSSQEIEDFEKLLSSQEKNSEIKYSVDTDIESEVKYGYLVEVYGKDLVDSVVDKRSNLFDSSYYSSILSKLEENK
jgi:hypothetical protein